jgi:hypothetical protein
MSQTGFELWLEFEAWVENPQDDPADDYFNMEVTLDDGRKYALNVWTYNFLTRAIADATTSGEGLGGKYLLPPDLFVERLNRKLLEDVVSDLIAMGEMKDEWQVPGDAKDSRDTE